jgi:hypothetical protein
MQKRGSCTQPSLLGTNLGQMRTSIFAASGAAVGALAGALLALVLKAGANRNCLDVLQQEVIAACAVPTAAPWAVALAAAAGAVLLAGVTAALARRR